MEYGAAQSFQSASLWRFRRRTHNARVARRALARRTSTGRWLLKIVRTQRAPAVVRSASLGGGDQAPHRLVEGEVEIAGDVDRGSGLRPTLADEQVAGGPLGRLAFARLLASRFLGRSSSHVVCRFPSPSSSLGFSKPRRIRDALERMATRIASVNTRIQGKPRFFGRIRGLAAKTRER